MFRALLIFSLCLVSQNLFAANCESLLREPVNSMDWIRLENRISDAVYEGKNAELAADLTAFIPESPVVRQAATLEVYSAVELETPLYLSVPFDLDREEFAAQFVQTLAEMKVLGKRDRGGSSLLIDWINAGVHIEATGVTEGFQIPEDDRKLFAELMARRSVDPNFDFEDDQSLKFVSLLAEALPIKTQEKYERLFSIFDVSVILQLGDLEKQNAIFTVQKLLRALQTQATSLSSKDDQLRQLFESAH